MEACGSVYLSGICELFGYVLLNCGLLSYFLLKYFFKSSVAKPIHTGVVLVCYC